MSDLTDEEREEIEEMLEYLQQEDPDNSFAQSLADFYEERDFLTERQIEVLREAYRRKGG